MQLGFSKN